MNYKVYNCNDDLPTGALDLLCQMKQHTIANFGQRNLHNNLLSHNDEALRQSISRAVKAAIANWTTTARETPNVWTGNDALLERAWLKVGPLWVRKKFAIPHSETCG
jgi:hypothetical protein